MKQDLVHKFKQTKTIMQVPQPKKDIKINQNKISTSNSLVIDQIVTNQINHKEF
jgi:hypothetical protein